jgi:pyruvate,water dikinase
MMTMPDGPIEQILRSLQERAKELNCLYAVDEILNRHDKPEDTVYQQVIEVMPAGWQYPEACQVEMTINDVTYALDGFTPTEWCLTAPIELEREQIGNISVFYTERKPTEDEGPFLTEERRLINAIAERIGFYIMQHHLREAHEQLHHTIAESESRRDQPWAILLKFLERTDPHLLSRITRKMINHLCWNGVPESEALLKRSLSHTVRDEGEIIDENRPLRRHQLEDEADLTQHTFQLASRSLSETEVVQCIQSWINEEKSTILIKSLENPGTGLAEMAEAIERYQSAGINDADLPQAVRSSLRVALLRKYFVESLDFINVAKNYVSVDDFYDLAQSVIHPARSQGKLGGKGAGIFLASRILKKSDEHADLFANLKIPKTWYIASDGLLDFIHLNDLEELYNTKYMEIERVRQDYPHIVQVFKNSRFPQDIVKGLNSALDDFGHQPIIVRSSSLLEDQIGAAFSGKYKSLFLANQGTKQQRMEALQDAIAEVYASIFGPDPIEYRAERGCSTSARRWASSSRAWSAGAWAITTCPCAPAWRSATTNSAGPPASPAKTAWCGWCPAWARAPSIA